MEMELTEFIEYLGVWMKTTPDSQTIGVFWDVAKAAGFLALFGAIITVVLFGVLGAIAAIAVDSDREDKEKGSDAS